MSTPFMGEIKIISWNFAPKGWAFCNGQLLPINQNQALFSILGTSFGGDGRVNFALPDFRGRAPIHTGGGNAGIVGQKGGEEFHTVVMGEMPAHNHILNASNLVDNTNTNLPAGNFPANDPINAYRTDSNTTFAPVEVTNVGGSQAHENRQPLLVLNFIIALQGIFPSRN
jgi:microcystin-dependent protein